MTCVVADPVPDLDIPLRPGQALLPGRSDAAQLLTVWYVRKSAYWLSFVGATLAHLTDRTDDVSWTDPGSVASELWSPLAGLILAVLIRFGTSIVGLAIAYRVVRVYRSTLPPQTGFASWISRLLDGRGLTLAVRRLRWSHHVRQEALARLGASGERVRKLDPILDVANIVSFVVMILVVVATVPS